MGEGEGAFYVEIAAGRILVQPYEYYDRDAVVYVDAETLFDVFAGTISISDVTSNGRLVVQGNYDATINLLEALVDQTQEDK
ncbi:MAG: SCP2 sterol-binding domain-containing protein [Lachnobacterium sp.]|nr:SCP2 sterol-binding domain-containing protein [Lachnobacterium sp.]